MLLLETVSLWQIFTLAGATWTLEHPEDPGYYPYPSIWDTAEVKRLSEVTQATVGRLDQCMHGAPSRKPTMVAGTVDPQEMASSLWLQCCHKGNHKKTLSGLDQEGRFLTTAAAQYPSSMNQVLVDLHVSAFLARGEPSQRAEGPELLQELALQDRKTEVRRGDRCRAPPLADFWDSKP